MQSHISKFASNPLQSGESSSHSRKAQLTKEEIDEAIATHQNMADEEKLTHILIRQPAWSSKIEVVLEMLAGESPEARDVDKGGKAPEQPSVVEDKVDSQVISKCKRDNKPATKVDSPKGGKRREGFDECWICT